jgi:hypothetical protein
VTLPLEGRWTLLSGATTDAATTVMEGIHWLEVRAAAGYYTRIRHDGSAGDWNIEPGMVSLDGRMIGGRIRLGAAEYGFTIVRWDMGEGSSILGTVQRLDLGDGSGPGTWEADETGEW